jgi:sugar phosphate isomerase/epimerase
MKFALQDKLTGLESYQDIFNFAKEIGFDGVEITSHGSTLTKEKANAILTALELTGINVSAVCGGYNHWIGDFHEENRLSAVKDIATTLEYTSQIGAKGLIAPAAYGMFSKRLPPFTPPRDEKGDREKLVDSLTRIAEYAEKYQVYFFLEPLNRYEDHMLNTISQAYQLVQEVGSSKIKIMADFFHMSIEEDTIVESIKHYYEHIGYYHLADSNRLQPGEGHTSFKEPLVELFQKGFEGYLSFECGIRGENNKQQLSKSLTYLKSINTKINI